MTEYATQALTALTSLAVGYALGWLQYGIDERREARGRRRETRREVRSVRAAIDAEHPGRLWAFHHDHLPAVIDQCARIQEDITPWRRRAFDAACGAYAGLTRDDLTPRWGPDARPDTDPKQEADRVRQRLHAALAEIERCAR